MKAIEKKWFGYKCNRCGNINPVFFSVTPCLKCGECMYCRRCLELGKLKMCEAIEEKSVIKDKVVVDMKLDYSLTVQQQNASLKILDCIKKHQNLLVYAVCGAGKTEMILAGIKYSLEAGLSVGIAIPRVDVVLELKERLNMIFTNIDVSAHYYQSEDTFGELPIMTINQAMKHIGYFDVLIIDEADAFPFVNSKYLQTVLNKSLTKDGVYIYMSATPSKKMLSIKNKVVVSSRFHGVNIPTIKVKYIDSKKHIENNKLPVKFIEYISENDNPLIVYCPTIHMVEQVYDLMTEYKINCKSLHSKVLNRKSILDEFKNREFNILITTTVLERGITVRGCNVIIFNGDHVNFNKSSIVQIAGRVGRKADVTTGDVTIYTKKITIEIIKSIIYIWLMNWRNKHDLSCL